MLLWIVLDDEAIYSFAATCLNGQAGSKSAARLKAIRQFSILKILSNLQKPLELNDDFKYALDRMEKTKELLFITGRAGTGKSTLLRLFRRTTRKKVVILAPTGVAALNVKGQTIHSFFGFPPRMLNPKTDIKKRKYRKLYQKVETIIIDEISMVRADLLDHIDLFLRINRENPQPFGGVQMIFFGDLFQLPPVVSSEPEKQFFQTVYESPYFFSSHILAPPISMEFIPLNKVYRQDSKEFLRLLEAIRLNRMDYDDLESLNERHAAFFEPHEKAITLSARNATVNSLNIKKLEEIPMPERVYTAQVTGNFPPHLYPTDMALKLKISAQVMFLKNDTDKKYVNGTIGTIVKLEDHSITILVEERDEKEYIEVKPFEWEIIKYKFGESQVNEIDTEVVGTYTQYPLKLAWAVTIHKAQGKTFDNIIIDLGGGAFEHGQTYVALSRCRTLEGVLLKKPLRHRDVLVDERVITFYEQNL